MTRDRSLDVAVTGIAGRFPGAPAIEEWWAQLKAGQVSTTRFDKQELLDAGVAGALLDDPDYVPVHGRLPGADRFENTLFRMTPREAEMADPQHRLMLESAWAALEDAGVSPLADEHTTAVYATASGSGYLRRMVASGRLEPLTLEDAIHGNEPDFMASLVSYKLGLVGPAVAVQTACSSSLVAVHMAVQALLAGDCDQALVVAAGIAFPQAGHLHLAGGIHSASGRCRPFDEQADGVVAGSGVGCVVLRRLADAVEDGVQPYGVILGTAVNNDGSAKAGYYAPSVSGQEKVIRSALRAADVAPDTIGYLEMHGTGTRVGDPIEWAAASAALTGSGAERGRVAVGALKANTGHLDNAAGLASLIKALLVVRDGLVPPVAGFCRANPLLETASPLYVPAEAALWAGTEPRRAGVSAFGIGGTNAHVIIEAAPAVPGGGAESDGAESGGAELILLSAMDPEALDRSADRLAQHLAESSPQLADVAFTLARGRAALAERLAVVGSTAAEVAERITQDDWRARGSSPHGGPAPVIFAFPGQGTQYPGMALPFAAALPGFTDALEECLHAFEPALAQRVRRATLDPESPAEELAATELAQPALFAVEYAAATALRGLGVAPAAVAGHSLGELTAACIAGILDLPDAADLIAARGQAMESCAEGSMLALGCSEEHALDLLAASGLPLELAAVNGPESCVLAGPAGAVSAFGAGLGKDVFARHLPGRRAFHSCLMEPALERLAEQSARITLRSPVIALATSATGQIIDHGTAFEPEFFVRQARVTVRFGATLEALARRFPGAIVVETGPGRVLSALAQDPELTTVALSPARAAHDPKDVLQAVGTLWALGQPLAVEALYPRGHRLHLPGYAFAGPRWVAPEAAPASGAAGAGSTTRSRQAASRAAEPSALMASLWAELLGCEPVTDESDFFDLGGDSLLITHLARRVRKELGVTVPIRELLVGRTLGRQRALVQDLVKERGDAVAAAS